jgi:hypothetical protein
MCAFSVQLIDFDQLSDEQTKGLLNSYQRKRKALQWHLEDVNESLKGSDRALNSSRKKSKRRA